MGSGIRSAHEARTFRQQVISVEVNRWESVSHRDLDFLSLIGGFILNPCYSKCGLRTSSLGITWELAANAES